MTTPSNVQEQQRGLAWWKKTLFPCQELNRSSFLAFLFDRDHRRDAHLAARPTGAVTTQP